MAEVGKMYGRQKSMGSTGAAAQTLCQYKFYPTYITASTVVQMKVEDLITCNEAASRFTPESRPTEIKRTTRFVG